MSITSYVVKLLQRRGQITGKTRTLFFLGFVSKKYIVLPVFPDEAEIDGSLSLKR
jgi:hypothetical protein